MTGVNSLPGNIYPSSMFAAAAGISQKTYGQWRARGFLLSRYKSTGKGHSQMYDFWDIVRGAVIGRLVSYGVSISSASQCVPLNLEELECGVAYLVVVDGSQVSKLIRESELLPTILNSETVIMVNLNKIKADVINGLMNGLDVI